MLDIVGIVVFYCSVLFVLFVSVVAAPPGALGPPLRSHQGCCSLGSHRCRKRSCVIAPVKAPSNDVAIIDTRAMKHQIVKEDNVAPCSWDSSGGVASAHIFMRSHILEIVAPPRKHAPPMRSGDELKASCLGGAVDKWDPSADDCYVRCGGSIPRLHNGWIGRIFGLRTLKVKILQPKMRRNIAGHCKS
eukprot:SAG31_NODE_33_length_32018_cov_69.763088_25_plen_189_part_00